MSVPGTQEQKLHLGGCVNCHTLQRVLFSRFDADEMALVVQRMTRHTNNSSILHPWMRPSEGPLGPPASGQVNFGKYLSSINLSATDTFEFPLKTLPRPKGKATQVIYTTYDLPRPDASPHVEYFVMRRCIRPRQVVGGVDHLGRLALWPRAGPQRKL